MEEKGRLPFEEGGAWERIVKFRQLRRFDIKIKYTKVVRLGLVGRRIEVDLTTPFSQLPHVAPRCKRPALMIAPKADH